MNKIELAKVAVRIVAGSSVGALTANVLKNNTGPAKNLRESAQLVVGAFVVGGMAAEAAENYAAAKLDEATDWWNEHVKRSK